MSLKFYRFRRNRNYITHCDNTFLPFIDTALIRLQVRFKDDKRLFGIPQTLNDSRN